MCEQLLLSHFQAQVLQILSLSFFPLLDSSFPLWASSLLLGDFLLKV